MAFGIKVLMVKMLIGLFTDGSLGHALKDNTSCVYACQSSSVAFISFTKHVPNRTRTKQPQQSFHSKTTQLFLDLNASSFDGSRWLLKIRPWSEAFRPRPRYLINAAHLLRLRTGQSRRNEPCNQQSKNENFSQIVSRPFLPPSDSN